jgi:imidazolonepropionase-like amidohydrolase
VITNGTLVDGTGAAPLPGATVTVGGNRIVAVGRATDLGIPPEATVLDAEGGTILPGIVDSHVHSASDPTVRRGILACGITSVCDLGSEIGTMPLYERDECDGEPVARGFRAGPMVTVPGGLPDALFGSSLNYEVTSPKEARAAVADLQGRGVDVIKVFLHRTANGQTFPILSLEQIQALVQEAHARGLPVRAHVWDLAATEVALVGGVDVIEHGPKPEISPAQMTEILASRDPLSAAHRILAPQIEAGERLLEQMVAREVVLVPTLERRRWNLEQGPLPKLEADFLVDLDLSGVRLFHELGGIVALGTDYNAGLDAKEMVLSELAFFARAGLTPMEVIEAATRHAARACGQGEALGTLQAGKLADAIVIKGDPLADMRALGNLRAVIVDGKIACLSHT